MSKLVCRLLHALFHFAEDRGWTRRDERLLASQLGPWRISDLTHRRLSEYDLRGAADHFRAVNR